MNEYFEANKRALYLLTIALILLAVVLYVMIIRPLMSDLTSKERSIDHTNEQIELLTAQLERDGTVNEITDIEQLLYEKKIPTAQEVDEYILSLQQIELMTNSKLMQIDIVYDSALSDMEENKESESKIEDELLPSTEEPRSEEESEQSSEEPEDNAESESDATEADSESGEEKEEITIDPIILEEKPDNLQVMTVRVAAISPDYADFLKVLKLIEREDRISIVTRLNFTQPKEEEIYFNEDFLNVIPFEVELTTFYYEN